MRTRRFSRAARLVLGGSVVAVCLPAAGCGGGNDTEFVAPSVTPADQAKGSMDYYRDQMKSKSKAARR